MIRLRPELMKYTPQRVESLMRRVNRRLSAEPGVVSVAYMQGGEGLVWDWRSGHDAQVSLSGEGREHGPGLEARKQDVSSEFFRTLKIPLLEGRGFTEQDAAGSPPDRRRWLLSTRRWHGVCGRVEIPRWDGPSISTPSRFRLSASVPICSRRTRSMRRNLMFISRTGSRIQHAKGDVRLVIRVRDDTAQALPEIRRAIQSIDSGVPVGEDMPLALQVRLDYMAVVMAQRVMTFCGVLALCLSAMGLYSVLAFAVRARSLEIGIRMAVGARRQDVLRLFLWDGARITLWGAAAGVVAALISTRMLRTLLYGVEATDSAIMMCAVGLFVLVALAACVLPASRAASISPMRVLRSE